MIFQRCLTVLIMSALVFPPAPATGQLSANVNVNTYSTVGLDEPTRKLIANFLPGPVKDQLLDFLKQALPLVKTNFDQYLKDVNNAVETQILNGQCAGVGLSAEFRQQFTKLLAQNPGPMNEFRNYEKKAIGRLKSSSDPQRYADEYGDLYHMAAVMHCQMAISGALENAVAEETKYRQLDFMWMPLVGRCKDASDCVQKVRQDTQNLIDGSDERDVQFVSATEKLRRVSLPGSAWFTWSFDPKPYESALGQMLDIQKEIRVAQARRQYMALGLVDEAKKKLAAMADEIAKGQAAIKPVRVGPCRDAVTPQKIAEAYSHADAAASISGEIEGALSQAIALDAANQTVEADKIRRDELIPRSETIKTIKNAKVSDRQIPQSEGCSIMIH